MLVDKSIKQYMDLLSSKEPAPGGGSVSAISGALGVSAMQMVCSLSMGKKDLEENTKFLSDKYENAEDFKRFFLNAIDEDCRAYPRVIASYRLPKATREERLIRAREIQDAYKFAAQIPFSIGKRAYEFLDELESIIGFSNKNVITDAYVSAVQLEACIDGAFINVSINLKFINDKDFVNDLDGQMEFMIKDSKLKINRIKDRIQRII